MRETARRSPADVVDGRLRLHEYVEWFRNDLAFRAPELWPDAISEFLDNLTTRFDNVDEVDS